MSTMYSTPVPVMTRSPTVMDPPLGFDANRSQQIPVSPDERHVTIDPGTRCHWRPGDPGQRGTPGVQSQIDHPQPPRHEEDAGLGDHVDARSLKHLAQLAAGVRLL